MASHSIQCLLNIEVFGTFPPEYIRLQNYQTNDLEYNGNTYQYTGFQIDSYPQSSLEQAGQEAVIWVRAIDPIPSYLRQFNGLRRSVVEAIHLLDFSTPIIWLLQVSSTAFRPGYVEFSLTTPTNALQGPAINRYFNSQEHPELLYTSPVLNR